MGNIKKRLNFLARTIIQNITVNPHVVRLLWKAVSEINYQSLLSLPDRDLSKVITEKVRDSVILDSQESQKLDAYLASKLLLIRDLADAV
ncbi:hypothetical protein [Chamaesiphon sp.]|uniref:hypothetical protein n=1 Tax=Chamaesiphon sp. TaxID=2814140 RepID=UPI00359448A0